MTTKQLLLHEVSMLQAHYDNLVKAAILANDKWDENIMISVSAGVLTSINNLKHIISKMN